MIIGRTNDCYSNLKDTKNMVQDGEKKLPLNFRINELELELKGRKDFRQAVRKAEEDSTTVLKKWSGDHQAETP